MGVVFIIVGYWGVSIGVECDHGDDVTVGADEVEVVGEYGKKDESKNENVIDFGKVDATYAEMRENADETVHERANESEDGRLNEGTDEVVSECGDACVMKGSMTLMLMKTKV